MQNPALKFKNFDEFLAKQAEMFGNLPCITEGETEKKYSYKEVNIIVNKTSTFLDSLGIKKGDRFAVLTRNCSEFLFLYLASMKLGTCIIPLVIDTPLSGIQDILKEFSIQVIFYVDERKNDVSEINIKSVPIKNLQKEIEKFEENIKLFSDVLLDDPGSLYFSSGTTGKPKGIPQSPKNLLTAGAALAEVYQFTKDDTQVGILPCYHTALTTYGFWPSLWVGSNFVIFERFHKHNFWKNLDKYQASFVEVVPTILTMLLNPAENISNYNLSHLKFIGSGSAPLLEPLHMQFENVFNVRIANQYGLSETTPTHFNDPRGVDRKFGSIGTSVPYVDAKIVLDNGNTAHAGEVGEILMKGDSIVSGYYKNPSEDAKVFRSGWFYTGDLGYQDEDGYYFIAGRKKEMINRGGAKIYPSEVDAVLLSVQGIKEAATIGIADEVYGEEVVAYIVPQDNFKILEDLVLNECKKHLPSYKCPKKIIITDEIPKTASGKILRRALIEKYNSNKVLS